MDVLRRFNENHNKLKHYVHTAWRVPLPRWGQFTMGCVYATIPIIGGFYAMEWTKRKQRDLIGEKGEKLRVKEIQGIGDQTTLNGETRKVGGGGLYGGVKLTVSDVEDQKRSKFMLEQFLKKEQRRMKKAYKKRQHGESGVGIDAKQQTRTMARMTTAATSATSAA